MATRQSLGALETTAAGSLARGALQAAECRRQHDGDGVPFHDTHHQSALLEHVARRIGEAHERVGLEPRWYLGAYGIYLSFITPLIRDAYRDEAER